MNTDAAERSSNADDLIGAEAWTMLNNPNRFVDTLEQMKPASDMHFVSGA